MQPSLDLNLIRTFLAVVSEGGLKGAAEELHMTPSAVSMQLKRLEDLVGKRVLKRNNQGIEITEAGKMLRRHGERLLTASSLLMAEMREQEPDGLLTLGIPSDYARTLLDQILPVIEKEFPALELRLTLEPSRQLRKRVCASDLDVAIAARDIAAPDGKLLWSEDLVWCGDAQNRNGELRFAILSTDCVMRDVAKSQIAGLSTRHCTVLESNSVASLAAAVEGNFAIALLPRSCLSSRIGATRNSELVGLNTNRLEFGFIAAPTIAEECQERIFHRLRDALQLHADQGPV